MILRNKVPGRPLRGQFCDKRGVGGGSRLPPLRFPLVAVDQHSEQSHDDERYSDNDDERHERLIVHELSDHVSLPCKRLAYIRSLHPATGATYHFR